MIWSVFRKIVDLFGKRNDATVNPSVAEDLNLETYLSKPSSLPTLRRDEKDTKLLQSLITREYGRVFDGDRSKLRNKALRKEFSGFCKGVWETYGALAEIYIEEMTATNERLDLDSDHWYEVNTSNAALFQDMKLSGLGELLPGRLFSTRMPRDLISHPENGEKFRSKVLENNLNTVVVLAESKEYDKYAGTDIEKFYVSLGLEVIHRPFEDFSIPDQPNMMANIKDVLWRLSEDKNILIHCAGGSGRTGMLIAGVVRNVGVKDPVTWVRRIKSSYIETPEQESFINSLPVALDSRICEKHPLLELAITAEFLLNLITPGHRSVKISSEHMPNISKDELDTIDRVFRLITNRTDGYITIADLEAIFIKLGVDEPYKSATEVMHHKEASTTTFLSKLEFINLISQKMVTSSRNY